MVRPLVTAVMVSGKSPERRPFALAAVQSFLQQDWPHKELLVVNDGPEPLLTGALCGEPLREIMVEGRRTLGELRNIGLDAARGDYCWQFDDDDWRSPHCLSYQLEAARSDHAVLLLHQVRYSFVTNAAFACEYLRRTEGIPGSVLHPRTVGRYRAEGKHEDSHFLNDVFGQKRVLLDNVAQPHLHLRFHRGDDQNTFSAQHVMSVFNSPQRHGQWSLPTAAAKYLKYVLETYYNVPGAGPTR